MEVGDVDIVRERSGGGGWVHALGAGGRHVNDGEKKPDICTKFEVAVECVGDGCGRICEK
jgi:hypothetical protein